MELMEDLDPEEARAIVDPALKLMIDAVASLRRLHRAIDRRRHLRAVRRAGRARGPSAARALRRAADAGGAEALLGQAARAEGRLPIQVRVGVNTGEVVVRSIKTDEAHTEYTPIGHSTSLASRMQTLAPTGSIAISEQARKLCEGYFTLKPLGPTKVKGVSEPVNVYEVTGLGPLRTRLQRSAGRGLVEVRGPATRDGRDEARGRAGQGRSRADRRRDGRGRGRQVASALRVQGGFAIGLHGAGSVLGLARQGFRIPAGDRSALELFRDHLR